MGGLRKYRFGGVGGEWEGSVGTRDGAVKQDQ